MWHGILMGVAESLQLPQEWIVRSVNFQAFVALQTTLLLSKASSFNNVNQTLSTGEYVESMGLGKVKWLARIPWMQIKETWQECLHPKGEVVFNRKSDTLVGPYAYNKLINHGLSNIHQLFWRKSTSRLCTIYITQLQLAE